MANDVMHTVKCMVYWMTCDITYTKEVEGN